MNRKAKNIIFWTVVGILGFIFVCGFVFGCIKTFFGAGTQVYYDLSKSITAIGLSPYDFFSWSTYLCIGAGLILTFMFFKKFNSRIN